MLLVGVYIFSEDGHALYVGRTNNMRKRFQYHTRNNHNQAAFAFLLARAQTGNKKVTYKKEGSRDDLLSQSAFRSVFKSARERIKRMDVQFIEELNPIRQVLLEIFAFLQAKAKYNDFDNH